MLLKLIRTYIKISSFIAPRITGRRSFRLFQKVRIKAIRKREEQFFQKTEKFIVPFDKEPIEAFETGNRKGKLVFLVHGWESNAGSMSLFADRLADIGYRVVAFNLPGHANHKSSSTNLLECYNAMQAVLKHVNPTAPFSVVSHSLGSAVTANALARSTYKIDRLVFLTSPNIIKEIFVEFKSIIGLNQKAYESLIETTEKLLGESLSTLNVDANVSKIDYDKMLIIHDKNDRVLSYKNSKSIHDLNVNTKLVTLEDVGHYKMLWTKSVVDQAVSFIEEK